MNNQYAKNLYINLVPFHWGIWWISCAHQRKYAEVMISCFEDSAKIYDLFRNPEYMTKVLVFIYWFDLIDCLLSQNCQTKLLFPVRGAHTYCYWEDIARGDQHPKKIILYIYKVYVLILSKWVYITLYISRHTVVSCVTQEAGASHLGLVTSISY